MAEWKKPGGPFKDKKPKITLGKIEDLPGRESPRLVSLNLSMSLLVKLASLAVHVEEMLSDDGHAFDEQAIKGILQDREVRAWLDDPKNKALLPVKRKEGKK